jgi:hypothetical protein
MAQEIRTMFKLPTIEIINLIAAIEDSILLKWKYQSNPDEPIHILKRCYVPPPKNRQGVLQVWDMMFVLSEDPISIKFFAEISEGSEDESKQ